MDYILAFVNHVSQERTRQKKCSSAKIVLVDPHPLQDLPTASVRVDFSGVPVYVNNVLKDPLARQVQHLVCYVLLNLMTKARLVPAQLERHGIGRILPAVLADLVLKDTTAT